MTATIIYKDIFLECDFRYVKGEERTHWHPGEPECIEDITVYHGGEDITSLVDPYMDDIQELIWNKLTK